MASVAVYNYSGGYKHVQPGDKVFLISPYYRDVPDSIVRMPTDYFEEIKARLKGTGPHTVARLSDNKMQVLLECEHRQVWLLVEYIMCRD